MATRIQRPTPSQAPSLCHLTELILLYPPEAQTKQYVQPSSRSAPRVAKVLARRLSWEGSKSRRAIFIILWQRLTLEYIINEESHGLRCPGNTG